MTDLGDEELVSNRAKDLEARAEERKRQICLLCNSRLGRNFLWWLCEQGSPFATSMRYDDTNRADPMRVAYAEGWRGLGSLILAEIMEAAPNGYVLMLSENRNVKTMESLNE